MIAYALLFLFSPLVLLGFTGRLLYAMILAGVRFCDQFRNWLSK